MAQEALGETCQGPHGKRMSSKDALLPVVGRGQRACRRAKPGGTSQAATCYKKSGGCWGPQLSWGMRGGNWLAVLPDRYAIVLGILLFRCQVLSNIGLCFKVMYSQNCSQNSEQICKIDLYPQDTRFLRI